MKKRHLSWPAITDTSSNHMKPQTAINTKQTLISLSRERQCCLSHAASFSTTMDPAHAASSVQRDNAAKVSTMRRTLSAISIITIVQIIRTLPWVRDMQAIHPESRLWQAQTECERSDDQAVEWLNLCQTDVIREQEPHAEAVWPAVRAKRRTQRWTSILQTMRAVIRLWILRSERPRLMYSLRIICRICSWYSAAMLDYLDVWTRCACANACRTSCGVQKVEQLLRRCLIGGIWFRADLYRLSMLDVNGYQRITKLRIRHRNWSLSGRGGWA